MKVEDIQALEEIERSVKEQGFDIRGWSVNSRTDSCVVTEEVITLEFSRDHYVKLDGEAVSKGVTDALEDAIGCHRCTEAKKKGEASRVIGYTTGGAMVMSLPNL